MKIIESIRRYGPILKRICLIHTLGVAFSVACAFCSGCATSGYMKDRMRDGADIFTIGTGLGGGVKARIGPVQTGLFADVQMVALRGGQFPCWNDAYMFPSNFELEGLFTGFESFNPKIGRSTAQQRRKSFTAEGHDVPFIIYVDPPGSPSYYTQIEVAGGLLLNLRLGFNPGELLDFVLGWVAIDIFDDDLGVKKTNESNKASQAIGAPGAPQPER